MEVVIMKIVTRERRMYSTAKNLGNTDINVFNLNVQEAAEIYFTIQNSECLKWLRASLTSFPEFLFWMYPHHLSILKKYFKIFPGTDHKRNLILTGRSPNDHPGQRKKQVREIISPGICIHHGLCSLPPDTCNWKIQPFLK